MKTAEDMAAVDRWIEEYALPHLMKTVKQQINSLPLKPGDEIMLSFIPGSPEMLIPTFVVEHFLEKTE